MTIKELVAMDIDIDCYDNVCEEIGIAYCGPYKLTEAGKQEFADVLEYKCEIVHDPVGYDVCIITVDDDPNIKWRDKLNKAKRFLYAIAGYCAEDDFDKWFIYID